MSQLPSFNHIAKGVSSSFPGKAVNTVYWDVLLKHSWTGLFFFLFFFFFLLLSYLLLFLMILYTIFFLYFSLLLLGFSSFLSSFFLQSFSGFSRVFLVHFFKKKRTIKRIFFIFPLILIYHPFVITRCLHAEPRSPCWPLVHCLSLLPFITKNSQQAMFAADNQINLLKSKCKPAVCLIKKDSR